MAKEPMDQQKMKKDVLYPEGYVEPDKAKVDKEAKYQSDFKAALVPLVKAMIKASPVPHDQIIKALGALGAPGGTDAWKRAIRDVEDEWHPDKYKPVEAEEPPRFIDNAPKPEKK